MICPDRLREIGAYVRMVFRGSHYWCPHCQNIQAAPIQ
jgi:hypothetical protein